MTSYDRTLGALMVASWLNASLFTVEGLQIYSYFSRFRKDSLFNRISVLLALISDIGGMVAVLASVYLYCVTHFGDSDFASKQPWSMPLYVFASALSGLITQTFLILRIYRLTGNIIYPIIFGLISAASLAGGLCLAITVTSKLSHLLYSEHYQVSVPVIIWLSCAAAVDIFIASALVWTLIRTKAHSSETESILRRLMIQAVRTGSVTAGAALIALILFCWSPNDNLCVFFSLSLGRLYSISMLSNLNARGSRGRGRSSPPFVGGERLDDSPPNPGEINLYGGSARLKGVHVESHTVTRIDEFLEEERGYGMRLNDVEGKADVEKRQRENELRQSDFVLPPAPVIVPYQASNHRDDWDTDLPLEHSQINLRP